MIEIFEKYKSIINNTLVEKYEIESSSYRIKIKIEFIDNSKLFVREYLFENGKRKYAYHWMDGEKKLRVRWDNAEHWENISTFPHHKHITKNENVEPSRTVTLEDVMSEIEAEINSI